MKIEGIQAISILGGQNPPLPPRVLGLIKTLEYLVFNHFKGLIHAFISFMHRQTAAAVEMYS